MEFEVPSLLLSVRAQINSKSSSNLFPAQWIWRLCSLDWHTSALLLTTLLELVRSRKPVAHALSLRLEDASRTRWRKLFHWCEVQSRRQGTGWGGWASEQAKGGTRARTKLAFVAPAKRRHAGAAQERKRVAMLKVLCVNCAWVVVMHRRCHEPSANYRAVCLHTATAAAAAAGDSKLA